VQGKNRAEVRGLRAEENSVALLAVSLSRYSQLLSFWLNPGFDLIEGISLENSVILVFKRIPDVWNQDGQDWSECPGWVGIILNILHTSRPS
jgi:hypothetical protein